MRRENIIDTPHMNQKGMDIPEHVCQSIKSRERLAFTDISWHSALEVARLHSLESRSALSAPHSEEPFPDLALRLVNQAYQRLKREAKRKGVAHWANDRKDQDYWPLPPVLKGVIAGANASTDRVTGVAKTYMVPAKLRSVAPIPGCVQTQRLVKQAQASWSQNGTMDQQHKPYIRAAIASEVEMVATWQCFENQLDYALLPEIYKVAEKEVVRALIRPAVKPAIDPDEDPFHLVSDRHPTSLTPGRVKAFLLPSEEEQVLAATARSAVRRAVTREVTRRRSLALERGGAEQQQTPLGANRGTNETQLNLWDR